VAGAAVGAAGSAFIWLPAANIQRIIAIPIFDFIVPPLLRNI